MSIVFCKLVQHFVLPFLKDRKEQSLNRFLRADEIAGLGMKELMKYFRDCANKFGNPKVIDLEKPAASDLRWEANPPTHIALELG
jgi:hypothetical protein